MYQLNIWVNADRGHPDDSVNVIEWGWNQNEMQLTPIMTPDHIEVAPESLLKLMRCNCKSSNNRCGETTRCSCAVNSLKCTKFCNCDYDGLKCLRSEENALGEIESLDNI